jgi:uncharacterized protein (TIGR03118 family)
VFEDKRNRSKRSGQEEKRRERKIREMEMRIKAAGVLLGTAVAMMASLASVTEAQYVRTDLASNVQGAAPSTDQQHLINSWGLTALPTSPFWLSDNGSGFTTLYSGAGQQIPLFVSIPPSPNSPTGSMGSPTGTVGNISPNATDFVVTENGQSAKSLFIFATMDGTISAWSPAVDGVVPDPTTHTASSHTTIMADRSKEGSTYTGLAIAANEKGEFFLFATDGGPNRAVDVFDSNFHYKKSLHDEKIPQSFTTYGIQAIDGKLWVTFTPLGNGHGGFVDVFNADGSLHRHNALHGPLDSPWGVALAPKDFGPKSGTILVSNNTPNGRILAFDKEDGHFRGFLRNDKHKAIEIDNIWAIQFGQDGGPNGAHNQLFFTGGPNNYADGIFGMITFDGKTGDGDGDRDDE